MIHMTGIVASCFMFPDPTAHVPAIYLSIYLKPIIIIIIIIILIYIFIHL
jgi:hypothetical protein